MNINSSNPKYDIYATSLVLTMQNKIRNRIVWRMTCWCAPFSEEKIKEAVWSCNNLDK
ncbi:hypothetical protein OROMI_015349 [Orobanche minor]